MISSPSSTNRSAGSAAIRADDLGEIAAERPARLGLQLDVRAVAEDQAAEAVPFGLELPALARRAETSTSFASIGGKGGVTPRREKRAKGVSDRFLSPDARHSPQFRHASSAAVKPA